MPNMNYEIELFNRSLYDWAERWWWLYCIKRDNNPTGNFNRDTRLYFPFFFQEFDFRIDGDILRLNPTEWHHDIDNLNRYLANLIKWKFPQYSIDQHKINLILSSAQSCADFDYIFKCIDDLFDPDKSLVSNIFFKHLFKPLDFVLFDQRSLRTFLLLNNSGTIPYANNVLWNGNVPSGKEMKEFYNLHFNRIIIQSIDNNTHDARSRFVELRKIDWALFAFDEHIISSVYGKFIDTSISIRDSISHKLENMTDIGRSRQLVY